MLLLLLKLWQCSSQFPCAVEWDVSYSPVDGLMAQMWFWSFVSLYVTFSIDLCNWLSLVHLKWAKTRSKCPSLHISRCQTWRRISAPLPGSSTCPGSSTRLLGSCSTRGRTLPSSRPCSSSLLMASAWGKLSTARPLTIIHLSSDILRYNPEKKMN